MPTSSTAPPAERCGVIELRQYTLHPRQRDTLIDLFDREFVETQEAVGMRVIGQFRDLDDADRFVWLRGYADMAARGAALPAFYDGPAWARHRVQANATMIDAGNVLLLRPAWDGATMHTGVRAAPGSTRLPPGLLAAWVLPLQEPASTELLALCRQQLFPALDRAGALPLGCYVTEPAANNFPRHPVREGEPMLVAFALFADSGALAAFTQGSSATALSGWFAAAPPLLRLQPTARSALHG